MWVGEGGHVRPWQGRKRVDVEVEMVGNLADAMLAASSHGVVVDDGRGTELGRWCLGASNSSQPGPSGVGGVRWET